MWGILIVALYVSALNQGYLRGISAKVLRDFYNEIDSSWNVAGILSWYWETKVTRSIREII